MNPYLAKPRGYRERPGTGLLVPEDTSRLREVWTRDEIKVLNRAMKLYRGHGVKVMLACDRPECPDRTIKHKENPAGEPIWVCGCRERTFVRHY